MKNLINLLLCLLILPNSLSAQDLLEPSDLNRDEQLRYTISLECTTPQLEAEFKQLFEKQIAPYDDRFSYANLKDKAPDIIVTISGNSSESMQVTANLSTLSTSDRSFSQSGKKSVEKLAKALKKEYFSGEQPTYSTIFRSGEEGYVEFRIPAVTALPNGDVIAFAEARAAHRDCAENDMVAKISRDSGRTWGEMIIIAQSGEKSLNNPVSLFIQDTQKIMLIFQEYAAKLHEGSAKSGMEDENITRTYITFSSDLGRTWTPKRDITKQVKLPIATGYATGPGNAIQVLSGVDKGRIIVPVNVSGGEGGWFNYLCYSDDFGENWKIFEGQSSYGTNESQIVQLSDHEFVINARCHKFKESIEKRPENWSPWNFPKLTACRGFIPVNLSGENATWGKTVIREDLPDPLCQGSMIRYSGLNDRSKSRILHANPASNFVCRSKTRTYESTPPIRINGVVRVSYDNTATWAWSKRIYGSRYTEYQYSVLTNVGKGKIGCVFEASVEIRYALFDMAWLTSGEDNGK